MKRRVKRESSTIRSFEMSVGKKEQGTKRDGPTAGRDPSPGWRPRKKVSPTRSLTIILKNWQEGKEEKPDGAMNEELRLI